MGPNTRSALVQEADSVSPEKRATTASPTYTNTLLKSLVSEVAAAVRAKKFVHFDPGIGISDYPYPLDDATGTPVPVDIAALEKYRREHQFKFPSCLHAQESGLYTECVLRVTKGHVVAFACSKIGDWCGFFIPIATLLGVNSQVILMKFPVKETYLGSLSTMSSLTTIASPSPGKSPVKYSAKSPAKSPSKSVASTSKSVASTSKSVAFPSASPSKSVAFPSASPSKSVAFPSASPSKSVAFPSASPSKSVAFPSASPSKSVVSPSKSVASPSKSVASPSKSVASPSKSVASPSASPYKSVASPSKSVAASIPSPVKSVAASVPSPAKLATFPAKLLAPSKPSTPSPASLSPLQGMEHLHSLPDISTNPDSILLMPDHGSVDPAPLPPSQSGSSKRSLVSEKLLGKRKEISPENANDIPDLTGPLFPLLVEAPKTAAAATKRVKRARWEVALRDYTQTPSPVSNENEFGNYVDLLTMAQKAHLRAFAQSALDSSSSSSGVSSTAAQAAGSGFVTSNFFTGVETDPQYFTSVKNTEPRLICQPKWKISLQTGGMTASTLHKIVHFLATVQHTIEALERMDSNVEGTSQAMKEIAREMECDNERAELLRRAIEDYDQRIVPVLGKAHDQAEELTQLRKEFDESLVFVSVARLPVVILAPNGDPNSEGVRRLTVLYLDRSGNAPLDVFLHIDVEVGRPELGLGLDLMDMLSAHAHR
ncbi:hypothetical protein FB446DRAFT_788480 [Lentinula raphanica]|nr:hypothetical protein FB446DRAFT_788480 [Lentinula raphanica]